jgi:uncharacterized protein involved in exopolysaccharide biosynthesis
MFAATTAATVYYVSHQPDYYESEASVLIRNERSATAIDPTGESMIQSTRESSQVRTEIPVILSESVAATVVDRLGPETILGIPPGGPDPAAQAAPSWVERRVNAAMDALNFKRTEPTPRDKAIALIRNRLSVRPHAMGSNVLRLTFFSGDPAVSQVVLDEVLDVYRQKNIELNRIAISENMLDQEINHLERDLESLNAQLDRLKSEHDIASLSGEMEAVVQLVQARDSDINNVNSEIIRLEAILEQKRKLRDARSQQTEVLPVDWSRDAEAQRLQNRVEELRRRYDDERLIRAAESPRLASLKSQLDDAQTEFDDYKSSNSKVVVVLDPGIQALTDQIEIAEGELEGLRSQQADFIRRRKDRQDRLNELILLEPEIKKLDEQIAAKRDKLDATKRNKYTLDFSRILDEEKVSNVGILDRATLPTASTKNLRKMLALLAFGAFTGLGMGLALAFGLDFFDQSIKTNEDVERHLGIPVLVSMPHHRRHRPELQGETS